MNRHALHPMRIVVAAAFAVAVPFVAAGNAGTQERATVADLQKAKPAISEEIAVVTGLPLMVEILDWDIALQTNLPENRLEIQAACTVRNEGPAPLDHLDFDLLAAEKFYGLHVEIAKITGTIGDRKADLSFSRAASQPSKEGSELGTHECPLVTRVTLPGALEPGQDCRLMFDYEITCANIAEHRHYNPIWEPEEGKKEVCLIADFTWFPSLALDLQKRIELSSERNFFLRGSKPAWRVTLTHPAQLEGMVIDGKLEKSVQAGSQTVSQWKSIVGGTPQVFIGPADRIERKGEKTRVVFLLPKGKYNQEFVDAVADLLIDAYSAYTDWFGPIAGNEVHIVSPSGIRGGHGAFLGMTIDASYFRRNKNDVIRKIGTFFVETPVHELAHCWWPESYGRGTKFLRESLANFAAWHLAREHYGQDLFTLSLRKGIFEQGRSDKPLFNAQSDDEGFAYVKGPLVLDLLRREMGDDVFFRTIREYVRRYRDSGATFVDFLSVCNEVSQRDWMPFLYQWCYARGCPGYHLVEYESKEGDNGWETTVTIRNSGAGIVRCPLDLQTDDSIQREWFAIQGGREKTFLYRTAKKVTAVTIDPGQTVYQEDLTEKMKSPAYLIRHAGCGRASNRELAYRYDKAWLQELGDAGLLLRTGFALYDMKRYEEALAVFEKTEELANGNPVYVSIAVIWQAHMLDLQGKHSEAIPRYEKVAAMELNDDEIHHDELSIVYKPSPYAKQRIEVPFTRVENLYED